MKWIKSVWNFLDGNKTMVGNGLVAIAAHLPDDIQVLDIPVVSVLYWVGGILSGGGLAHKVKKSLPSGKRK